MLRQETSPILQSIKETPRQMYTNRASPQLPTHRIPSEQGCQFCVKSKRPEFRINFAHNQWILHPTDLIQRNSFFDKGSRQFALQQGHTSQKLYEFWVAVAVGRR
jgi:hypothetical protein